MKTKPDFTRKRPRPKLSAASQALVYRPLQGRKKRGGTWTGYYREEYTWKGECPHCGAGEEFLSTEFFEQKGTLGGFRVSCARCGYFDCTHETDGPNRYMHSFEGFWSALTTRMGTKHVPDEIAGCDLLR